VGEEGFVAGPSFDRLRMTSWRLSIVVLRFTIVVLRFTIVVLRSLRGGWVEAG
jgi:hypothetical protein